MLAPALFVTVLCLSFPSLKPEAHRLAAILAGVVVAALGSALAGLGAAGSALFSAAAALLLYAGFVAGSGASVVPHAGDRAFARRAPATLPPPDDPEAEGDREAERGLGDQPRDAAVRDDVRL